ncbi:hypothetical protein V8G54_012135 [Vigna mungo]|uniref:Uncharacterized protein n=1 Tax=Vigna mungo TaxID=3915 RepID=A0AAQ3S3Q6_VIGMU
MGNNNVAGFVRLRGSLPFPSHIQLGTDATINMKTISRRCDDGGFNERAEVLYTVEGSKCKLSLGRLVCNDGSVNVASFVLNDSIICPENRNLCLPIYKMDTGFACPFNSESKGPITWKTRKNVDAWDGVTETKVCLYGTANRCGLLVWEGKKNDYRERNAKTVTIAHYFVSCNGSVGVNRSSETTDIGFSVVAKVELCDGKYDITVEGPEPHPVFDLLHMFNEVNKTGIWKPSMCPHCRNIRREHSRMQSDSEDDVVPLPPRLGSQRNPTTIANNGRFRGHANGSYIRCRNFYGYN